MRIRVTAVDLHGCWVSGSRLSHDDIFQGCRSDDATIREGYREIAIAVLLEVRSIASEAYREHVFAPPRRLTWGGRIETAPDPASEQRFRDWDRLLLRYWNAIRQERSTRPIGNREVSS